MKLFRYLLPLVVAVGLTTSFSYATQDQDGSRYLEELNERDFDALKDFINSKRTINLQEKSTNLTISGDVRTEWRHLNEKLRGFRLRGGGEVDFNGLPISRNDFNIAFNLRFDYVCDKAWAVAHIEYDNSAGVDDNGKECYFDPEGYHGSGFSDDISLRKAYMGYNVCCDGDTRFDVELGRRNLYNVFDSKIQFLSRFDGLLFKYSSSWECVADWYINLGGFVVDERVNHFAWITEIGFLNIADSGIDFKYSFIDWEKNGKNRCFVHNPRGFKFMNSQFTLAYHFDPEMLCTPATLYAAFLWNHAGHKHRFIADGSFHDYNSYGIYDSFGSYGRSHGRKNLGWYVGFTVGQVVREGDWSVDIQYQVVQANAIPDNDVSGIGRGNTLHESFTSVGRGNTNYKGWRIEGLYALTDNLCVDSLFEFSRADDKNIGGSHHYSNFEIEAIYAF